MPNLASKIASSVLEELELLKAPPTAFHFAVNVGLLPQPIDSSFQDVSGLDQTMETETLREGGENRFVHQLPIGVQQGKLSLRRGIARITSPLMLWCKETMEGGLTRRVRTLPVMVRLKGSGLLPLRVWVLDGAYPVRWEIEAFNSTKNELAIEHIELAYTTCTRML
jgi:phage tail-like protein